MNRLTNILIAAAMAAPQVAGSFLMGQDMRHNAERSLFADQKGVRIGDVLTVLVMETASATNDAKTSASRDGQIAFSAVPKLGDKSLPDVGLNMGSSNTFNGQGSTVSNGSVRAKISARVDSVFANGNLFITGFRTISVNGEQQILRINGIVRPSDIQPDNSVYSYNISQATIALEGNGVIDRSQGPGFFTRLFHWLF